jgi:hypothetical protein
VPLVVVDLIDGLHDAVVEALDVPQRDRYQVVHENHPSRMVVQDTGLGIERSRDVVVIQVTSRPRLREQKVNLYRLVCEQLQSRCDISPRDVMISIVENSDEDWSFGLGRAQFLTGDL